jgi:Zn finger protein HypA/HybF involved in hydrogenase expression
MPKGLVTKTAGKNYQAMVDLAKSKRIPDNQVFVENSTLARHHVKRRLIKERIIEYKCESCNNDGNWNGKELVLQLEHKNGVSNDNRLENLSFLCPNCHTQTKTYAAKNRKNPSRKPKSYIDKDGILRNITSV